MPDGPRHVRHLIVGGGIAGGVAFAVLSRQLPEEEVLLIGAEHDEPYERPLLSKEYLKNGPSQAIGLRELAAMPPGRGPLLGKRVVALHDRGRSVVLDDGMEISFDNLLIATGVENRVPELPGVDLAGVHTLRSLEDARALHVDLGRNPDVLIIGAGLIGTEFASECVRRGLAVTVLEAQAAPLLAMSGHRGAELLTKIYADRGVDLRTAVTVSQIDDVEGRRSIVLDTGERFEADLVLLAVGARPAVSWLSSSSVIVDNGVVVDEFCQTNVQGVYAAGDVARAWHPGLERHVRIEHESNAHIQGVVAARNMLGRRTAHTAIPFAWSDQFGHHLWSFGLADPADEVVTLEAGSRFLSGRFDREGKLRSVFGLCREDDVQRDALEAATRDLINPPDWRPLDAFETALGPLLSLSEELT